MKIKISKYLLPAAELILCIASANATVLSMPSPFHLSILALSGDTFILSFLISTAVYFITGNISANVCMIVSATILTGLRILCMLDKRKLSKLHSAVLPCISLLISLIITAIFYRLSTKEVIYYIFASVLCSALTYIALTLTENLHSIKSTVSVRFQYVSIAIIFVVVTCILSSVTLFGINIGRVLCVCTILCCCRKFKSTGGAVAGALSTCAVFLSSPELSANTMLFATSGLICGLFSSAGILANVLVFMIATALGLAVGFVNNDSFALLKECAIGCVIFSCIPEKATKALFKSLGLKSNAVSVVGQTTSSRLNFASSTLASIRKQITDIADTIKRKSKPGNVSDSVTARVCTACKASDNCSAIENDSFGLLEKKLTCAGFLTVSDVLEIIPHCKCPTSVCSCCNEIYKQKMYNYTNEVRTDELREIVTEQLLAMESILTDMSGRIGTMSYVDSELSDRITEKAKRLGLTNVRSSVFYDEKGNCRAELFASSEIKTDFVRLTMAVSDILSVEMNLPIVSRSEFATRMIFYPKPEYELRVGVWQSSAQKDTYSGDTVEIIPLGASEEYIVLSDGMGTGKRARLDSLLASSLVSKLVRAGVSCNASIRMINSVMRVKGWEESFATLDIAKFDLYNGVCDFVKAGAASSFLVRDGVISEISVDSMPLGILSETYSDVARKKLFHDDIVILASDGIGDNAKRIIEESLSENTDSSDKLARLLGSRFCEIIPENRRDDISIIVIKVLCTSI